MYIYTWIWLSIYVHVYICKCVCVQTCYTETSVWYDCVTPARYPSSTRMSIDSMSLDGTPESFLLDGTNGFVSQVMGTSWFNTKSSRLCKSTEDTYREITGPHGKRAAHMMIKTGAICCFKKKAHTTRSTWLYICVVPCLSLFIYVYSQCNVHEVSQVYIWDHMNIYIYIYIYTNLCLE